MVWIVIGDVERVKGRGKSWERIGRDNEEHSNTN
jgi:hypothetical protein